MQTNDLIFKELIRRGYSLRKRTRVWDIADSKLWYLTPELSNGFLKFAKYRPYRKVVVDAELDLLMKNMPLIIRSFDHKKFNLVDLGCGNGIKSSAFIKELPVELRFRYCPFDISPYFIDSCVKKVKSLKKKNVVEIKKFVSDFKDLDEALGILRNKDFHHNLILLLGETVSHYDVNDFLFNLSNNMFSGDVVIIGNGYRVGKRFEHIEKYKDSLFNQWFIHIIKGLGLGEKEVKFDARFANNRLEFYYTVLKDKKIDHKGKKVYFMKGDEIVVGIQNKYYKNEWINFCEMYFRDVKFFHDSKNEYSLMVCKK